MAVTKVHTIAKVFELPKWNCRLHSDNDNIVVCGEHEFYVFSERWDLRKASWEWVEQNGWKLPIEFILKHSIDTHRSFFGVTNDKAVDGLKRLQAELKEDFNEIVFALIANKTNLWKDVCSELGYMYMWQPIDGKETIFNGFRIYKIK